VEYGPCIPSLYNVVTNEVQKPKLFEVDDPPDHHMEKQLEVVSRKNRTFDERALFDISENEKDEYQHHDTYSDLHTSQWNRESASVEVKESVEDEGVLEGQQNKQKKNLRKRENPLPLQNTTS
jgi:hypothetical protein